MTFRFFALIFCATLFAEEDIVVNLPTQSRLLPVHIEQCPPSIREVLQFDLEQSGRVQLTNKHVAYSISCATSGDKLQATLTRVTTGAKRNLTINGTNRQAIHQLADALHQEMFGKPGIASMRLLYTIEYPGRSEIWISDYDGHNARRLAGDQTLCISPIFLPPTAGRRAGSYFYVNYETGQSKIYGATLQGGTGRRLINLRGNQLTPAISPQRDQIAFVSDAGGNPDLFLQHFSPDAGAVGKPQQIFSSRRAAQASPTFSPDGRRLAFVSNKDGSPRVYLLDLPEPGVKLRNPRPIVITLANRENTCPSWSPDGRTIAYSARSGGARQIWLYDVETGQERQLTQGSGHKENPCWAHDSEHLIYNSADSHSCELFMVSLHRPKPLRLTSGPGEKRFPSLSS